MSDTTADVAATSSDHHMRVDSRTGRPREILIVVANPAVSSNNHWPVGFWGAELTHPYYELTEAGFQVTIASPAGGRVEMDALSDPRDPSRWSAEDLIRMGFVNTPELAALLEATPALDDMDSPPAFGREVPPRRRRPRVTQRRPLIRRDPKERPYISAGLFKPFAVRDGRLITGQQHYSGRKVAQAVIAAVGA
ncbi:hypothetical protein ABT095_30730 [Kitasatospora sp. NPDC002227]|uniref:hypothetical protein n=1 Tax=Kitasatospora sp. NPDC002227 TaxID=3154773 RepID=UPI0033333F7D